MLTTAELNEIRRKIRNRQHLSWGTLDKLIEAALARDLEAKSVKQAVMRNAQEKAAPIMGRVHERDVTGVIESVDVGKELRTLPQRIPVGPHETVIGFLWGDKLGCIMVGGVVYTLGVIGKQFAIDDVLPSGCDVVIGRDGYVAEVKLPPGFVQPHERDGMVVLKYASATLQRDGGQGWTIDGPITIENSLR